jgi:hypothetical protein
MNERVSMMQKKNRITFQFPPTVYESAKDSNKIDADIAEPHPHNSALSDQAVAQTEAHDIIALNQFKSQKEKRKKKKWASQLSGRRSMGSTQAEIAERLKFGVKLILTIGSAVGIGVLLGLLILTIFGQLNEQSPPVHLEQGLQGEVERSNVSDGALDEPPLLIPPVVTEEGTTTLPARVYHVVQAGAFSEREKAHEGYQQLKSLGFSGLLLEDDSIQRLLIGMAAERGHAVKLAAYFVEQELETFVREHVTAEVQLSHPANEVVVEALTRFLNTGDRLLGRIAGIAMLGITDSEYQLSLAEWNDLKDTHHQFVNETRLLQSSWSEQEGFEQMARHIAEAMHALETFRKQPHQVWLWSVQDELLGYLQSYENISQNE